MNEIEEIDLTPQEILHTPLYNKGTAFTHEERVELGIEGLLPHHVSTIEEQVARRYMTFLKKRTMLGRFRFLNELQDRNEVLFYRFVHEHVESMLPLIYTPTVGEASIQFSYIYNQNRGVYLSYPSRENMAKMISNIPRKEIDVIVVTDGERILGLGDLGVGGMTIPVGKLSLYTLFGGIHPSRVLPVFLDVGTNNPKLLNDPLYLGWHHERIRGQEYDHFVNSFVTEIKKRYPNVLLQWEDFAKPNAYPLLERYRKKICSFNDDIQGTASVALAAILSAVKSMKSTLSEHKIAIFGGGSAGMGIASLILKELVKEGMSEEKALKLFYIIDIQGLVHTNLKDLSEVHREFAQDLESIKKWEVNDFDHITLLEVIKNAGPSILIGVSTQTGAFSIDVVKEMAKRTTRPIIFPLSNPTSMAEAQPEDLITWTEGKAIIATGSPFKPIHYNGRTLPIGQCNNVYIFPGVGLGIISVGAKEVTDEMFLKAAEIVSEESPMLIDPYDSLFPSFKDLRQVSLKIACAVGELAKEKGLATKNLERPIHEVVKETMWFPEYPHYKRANKAS